MGLKHNHLAVILRNGLLKKWRQMMSKKCRAFSASKLGKPDSKATLREAFYAGWEAALAEHQEPVEATPYTLKRIAWELERTAVGDGFYGNALRVAKDMPGITPEDRSVLDRYATGTQTGTDHVHLQWLAQRLENKA